jgi:hypothetical protein
VIVLETRAWLVLARPDVAKQPPGGESPSLWLFFLLFGRTVAELAMLFGALAAAGFEFRDSLGMAAMLLVVVKFLVCLFALMSPAPRPDPRRLLNAQLVAVVWSCLAYTMTWGRVLGLDHSFADKPLGGAIADTFAAAIMFLLLYCPIRVHAVLAVVRGQRTARQEWGMVAGIGVISLASLWGYDAWWVSVIMPLLGAH